MSDISTQVASAAAAAAAAPDAGKGGKAKATADLSLDDAYDPYEFAAVRSRTVVFCFASAKKGGS
jgi:hypothetical protein